MVILSLCYMFILMYMYPGDMEEDRNPDTVCVANLQDFTSCFLFSIETQHTIGYL